MPPAPPGAFPSVPDPLPRGEPGEPIWAERIAAPAGSLAWRMLYHSRALDGTDIAVSGLLVAPDSGPPPGGFPVLAYAHGTTGLADACAPSRGAEPLDPGVDPIGSLPLPPLADLGYIVVATDYEGLGTPGRHPYLVGESEARSILDGVRAARAIPEAHAADRTVVLGVSQGGHAALFAGEHARAYAPEIDLAGIVALAPAAELALAAQALAGDESLTGFAVAIGAGFAAAHDDLRLEDVLTPAALAQLDVVDSGCIDDVLAAFAGPLHEFVRPDALLKPPWPALIEANTPGRAPSRAPIFVGQGSVDELVIPELTDALVVRLCSLGDDVTYRRYSGADHGAILEAAADDLIPWVADRMAGRPSSGDACLRLTEEDAGDARR